VGGSTAGALISIGEPTGAVVEVDMDVENVESDVENDDDVNVGVGEVEDTVVVCPPSKFCFRTAVHIFPPIVVTVVDIVT
jgi:hypothetical protein